MGLVDTWAIGHLPRAAELAAVGVGATVFSYIFWAFGFLRMGTTGLSAQAHGRDDQDGLHLTVLRSLVLSVMLGLVLISAQALFFSASLTLLTPPTDTAALYEGYFDIRIWAAPATLCIYTVSGYLIGTEQARKALYLQLLLNLVNGSLNLLFVIGLGMGVQGIALGSLIAECVTAGAGLFMVAHHFTFRKSLARFAVQSFWTLAEFLALARTNSFIFIRTLLLLTTLAYVTRSAGHISEPALAASHILSIFMLLISLGLDGFAYAAEALTGGAYGRKDRSAFMKWCWLTSLWATGASVGYSIAFFLLGDMIIQSLTVLEAVQNQAMSALPVIIALPILSVACFQLDGIYIGATASAAMSVTMAVSFVVFFAVVHPLVNTAGLSGLWAALVIFMVVRGITQAIYFPYIAKKLSVSV